jgi:hypothetical protein
MAKLETLTIALDTDLLCAAVRGCAATIAKHLRELPRQTEDDGSQWVNAELLDEIATKLDAV